VSEVSIIGLDIAKHVFQAHGVDRSGKMVFRKKLSRVRLLPFFASQPGCMVALEACGGAHYWARELMKLGHDVRLIAPAYVKPFVKRQKTDAADAEAICEAAQRPTMRFVPVKTEARQASAMVFRGRDLLVRQRTQISNALRGHMAEYGWVAPKGLAHLDRLAALIADPAAVPEGVRSVCTVLLENLAMLDRQIAALDKEMVCRSREDAAARRLMTIPEGAFALTEPMGCLSASGLRGSSSERLVVLTPRLTKGATLGRGAAACFSLCFVCHVCQSRCLLQS
jgi:transposase